ncbi:hypothetical protein MKX03_010333 [Papaver bracteatum]|nr:hypothetical protein MKX03_010333 [Papaver bracteatum]
MKFTALLSLFLMCFVLSNGVVILKIYITFVGMASAYECDKAMSGIFRGPCQPHCSQFCKSYYQGTGECYDGHSCMCSYHSSTPCQ